MTNRDLIKQLKELKQINPDKEWVALTYSKLLSNTSISYIEKPNSKSGLFGGLDYMLKMASNGRFSYAAVAVFVFAFGVFSTTYTSKSLSEIDIISASMDFIGSQDKKVRIVIDDSENVVNKEVANAIKKIANEAGASFSNTVSIKSNSDSYDNKDVFIAISDLELTDEGGYTVVFKENSNSKERFTRIIIDTIEVKIYDISQSAKSEDEKIRQQTEAILSDARKAYGSGELIEALELVNAAEKYLFSATESK